MSEIIKTNLILVGGYLGAGKTTVLSVLSELLHNRDNTVGFISNDQTSGLVDTHILKLGGAAVEEVSGSCFCCDFQGFMDAVNFLTTHAKCKVIVAEPVGSCTDLSATLLQPVKAMYADVIDLAPLSVLADPLRLMEVLENSREEGPDYIYIKQLEESDYIVVNKTDLLDEKQWKHIETLLSARFPEHSVCRMSALRNTGVSEWLERLLHDPDPGKRLASVDYEVYARAEAMTGWYNGTFIISGQGGKFVDWGLFHKTFLELLEKAFAQEGVRTDHLKTFLKGGASHLLGNIAGYGGGIAIRGNNFTSQSARLVLNIRAVTTPILINEIVEDVIHLHREHGYLFEVISVKHIIPGRPQPNYRYGEVL